MVNTPIVDVNATDNDEIGTPNSEVTFALENPSLPFMIDPNSGLLSTRLPIPDLMARRYMVRVVATDGGSPSRSSIGVINVDVAAPNFNDPVFPTDLTFSIMENDPSTTTNLFEFQVTDSDSGLEGEVQLTLLPSRYSDNFTLISMTESGGTRGILRYRGGPGFDREELRNFTLPVRATDQGNLLFRRSTDDVLNVIVSDINDNPPIFVNSPYTAVVSEDAEIGSTVTTIETSDADENADIQFFFPDYSGSEFLIGQMSGVITTNQALLVSSQAFYRIRIRATDGVFESFTYINITILEVNDNPPQFNPPLPPIVFFREDILRGTVVLNISVSDVDTGVSGEATLSISQDEDIFGSGVYSEPNNFYIFLNRMVDFEVSKTTD